MQTALFDKLLEGGTAILAAVKTDNSYIQTAGIICFWYFNE